MRAIHRRDFLAQAAALPLMEERGLISWWTFQEASGEPRQAHGRHPYRLLERGGEVERVEIAGAPFGPFAARLRPGRWFEAANDESPALNLYGPHAEVTVAAWIQRHRKPGAERECEAIAGVWDETHRRRQYCLFLNLQIWESANQVCGHVSSTGGPTAGYPYCMDASIGATPVPFDTWQFAAFTYDGREAKSYLNGRLDVRAGRNPYRYPGGLFDAGAASFTVGAVHRANEMGNWFAGLLGGLAVFDRALSKEELLRLSDARTVPSRF